MALYLLLAVCGSLVGVTTVLFGFGGGFFVVPLLYQALTHLNPPGSAPAQAAMQIAVATSTAVMVVGSLMATLKHQRARSLNWALIRPLLGFIAAGAMLGALAATSVQGEWLRWAFVAYLALTIADCWLRPGFMHPTATHALSTHWGGAAPAGLLIGSIAAFLGVGGSVMTVTMMRRRGVSMTGATAMASPLSLPVALAGTATYMAAMGSKLPALDAWHWGLVDLRAWAILVAGSWLGMRLATPWIGRIPDRIHAKVYLGLLVVVLVAMLLG